MKIFARKEFPLYKPESGGWYTCEIGTTSHDDSTFVTKLDLLYKTEDKAFFDANMEEVTVCFFYEETNAYVPKDDYVKELEHKIELMNIEMVSMNSRITDLEINYSTPMSTPLDVKVNKLHAVVDYLVSLMEDPPKPEPHPHSFKLRNKLHEIIGGIDSSEQIW